ncbi:MAG: hypothetical protein IPL64_08415 [Flavobacteriales bacterium]|nr:hypothetical protein [Flavobacteriales bacterium]
MQRRRFVLSVFASTALAALAQATNRITMSIKKGFNTVPARRVTARISP